MFFWNITETINICPKASLQACHRSNHPKACDKILNPKSRKIKYTRRTFCLTPPAYQASMCLEAAFSFSFFLFFLVNVFSMLFLFSTYAKNLEKIQQQGKELAIYAYSTGNFIEDENQLIVLKDSASVDSPFPFMAVPNCKLISQCVIKPWTGYCVTTAKEREQETQIVYITDYGEVYHTSRSCKHLALTIRITAYSHVKEERNEEGARYYPCEYCGSYSFSSVAFLTSWGNKYHSIISCRGLKRTIQRVSIEECKGMPVCKSCG